MTTYSQPGIFNVLDPPYSMSPAATPAANAAGLQHAINDAQTSTNPYGAIVLIPSFDGASPPNYGTYKIAIPSGSPAITVSGTGSNGGLLICGTGNGTTLQPVGTGTLFEVSDGLKPVTFQDLSITMGPTDIEPITAFDLVSGGAFGASFFRVNVTDCSEAFNIATGSTTLLQCTVTYDAAYPSDASCAGIFMHGGVTQVNVEQCSLLCANVNEQSVGIQIDYSYWARVTDCQISGFSTGILFDNSGGGTTRGATFAGVDVDATGSCLVINSGPQGGHGVYDISLVNCHFQPTTGASPGASGIVVSPGPQGNVGIDTVRLTSCAVIGYPAPYYGLEIDGGHNIQVTGGDYSGNGGAGIAIIGPATEIQITGASCVGLSYANPSSPIEQQYGIYATAGQDIQIIGVNCCGNGTSSATGAGIFLNAASTGTLTDVRIVGAICCGPAFGDTASLQQYGIYASLVSGLLLEGCTLTNNLAYAAYLNAVQYATVTSCDLYSAMSGAQGILVEGNSPQTTQYVFIRDCNGAQFGNWHKVVSVSGTSVANLEVTNCAGYNDTAAPLATTPPASPFGGVTYGYYGPVTVYGAGSVNVSVNTAGHPTGIANGTFPLAPGQTLSYGIGTGGHTWTTFLVVGG